jgi:glycine betaine/choline ABC-type transport system substrate-binding protein
MDRQADVAVGSATDAQIQTLDLVMLADDRHAFPPYEAVPVVRRATLERFHGLDAVLASLAGKLSATTMRRLNAEVDGEHRSPAEVVRALLAKGL